MRPYIGSKIIMAEPMIKSHFNAVYQAQMSTNKDAIEEGYHVVYPQSNGGQYHSWSPKREFEIAYREITKGESLMVSGNAPALDVEDEQ